LFKNDDQKNVILCLMYATMIKAAFRVISTSKIIIFYFDFFFKANFMIVLWSLQNFTAGKNKIKTLYIQPATIKYILTKEQNIKKCWDTKNIFYSDILRSKDLLVVFIILAH